ncbi:hypothetical protein Bca101_086378 [Brassica carinata]
MSSKGTRVEESPKMTSAKAPALPPSSYTAPSTGPRPDIWRQTRHWTQLSKPKLHLKQAREQEPYSKRRTQTKKMIGPLPKVINVDLK